MFLQMFILVNTNKAQYIVRTLFGCPVLVFSLFCLNAIIKADPISGLSMNVEGPSIVCVHQKQSVNLTCTLSLISRRRNVNESHYDNVLTHLNIKWHSKGDMIENSSIVMQSDSIIVSTLEVYVNWTKDKVFTCFSDFENRNLSGQQALNASVTVTSKRPEQTRITGVRFMEASERDYKVLEIYWKQNEKFNYTYSLRYSIEIDEEDDSGNKLYTINNIECFDRSSDVYRVPNTTGHICQASIKKKIFLRYTVYTAYLVTSRERCKTSGPMYTFMPQLDAFGEDPGPDKYQIVFIPRPVDNLTIRVARQQVELTWTNMANKFDTGPRRYRLRYNCSKLEVEKKQTIIGKTRLTLYSSNFSAYRPYALCEFCIRVLIDESYVPSLPVCRKARLHEEAPSKPPIITCTGKDCPTISDGLFRNVTIPWVLPPRVTWNGVLTLVAVSYHRAENGSLRNEIISERNVTQGFTVIPKLAPNSSYIVQAAVCNKEGCSTYGKTIVIPEAALPVEKQPQGPQPKVDGKSSDNLPFILGLGSLSFILAVIVVVVGVWCYFKGMKKKREQKEDQLPELNESLEYDNICGDQMVPREYDVLSDDVLIEQGESNAGCSDGFQETSVF